MEACVSLVVPVSPEEVRALMHKYRLPSYDWEAVSLSGLRMKTTPTTATAEFQCFPQEAPDGTRIRLRVANPKEL